MRAVEGLIALRIREYDVLRLFLLFRLRNKAFVSDARLGQIAVSQRRLSETHRRGKVFFDNGKRRFIDQYIIIFGLRLDGRDIVADMENIVRNNNALGIFEYGSGDCRYRSYFPRRRNLRT